MHKIYINEFDAVYFKSSTFSLSLNSVRCRIPISNNKLQKFIIEKCLSMCKFAKTKENKLWNNILKRVKSGMDGLTLILE